MAVAIWNERPDADDLLDWHLAMGWRPQVSELIDGDKILGHAACLR